MIISRNKRKNKTLPTLRYAVFVFVSFGALLFPSSYAQAGYWGEPTAAAQMKFTMETIRRSIEGALLGSLKVAAVQMLNRQVSQAIGGGSSGRPRFITSYDNFLYQTPRQRTDLYMNDFFTLTTRGRGSSANYIGVGDRGGVRGNYSAYLVSTARQSTTGSTMNTYTLGEYTPSPQAMFREGDFRAFNAFFSNPANNPYGYTLMSQNAYQNRLTREQEIARTQAVSAGGFLPVERGGRVITPGGSVAALQTNVQNLPNLVIASAENPSALLSGVVAAMANKMISGLINNGIGQARPNSQRTIGGVNRQTNGVLNSTTRNSGLGSIFQPIVSQRTNVNVNPDSSANINWNSGPSSSTINWNQ